MAKKAQDKIDLHLERWSTEQLEELLRADIASAEDGDTDVLFHILEVIEQRENKNPTGRLPAADKAWENFQTYYNTPAREGQALYPCEPERNASPPPQVAPATHEHRQPRRLGRQVRIALLTIVLLFVGMVGVQAAGIDVFGALGRWTEETFHFVSSDETAVPSNATPRASTPEHTAYYNAMQKALQDCGISENLSPSWYPDGFTASAPEILSDDLGYTVNFLFYDGEEAYFSIRVMCHNKASDLALHTFEKDDTPIETYTPAGRTFYLMSNLANMTATWSDGTSLLMSISGALSTQEIKAMIDSIGGSQL